MMDPGSDIGFWELSIIMVVIASWILYRYVAPKGWREWTRAGLVQAFIIALYAEMYGFPLTTTDWLAGNQHPVGARHRPPLGVSLWLGTHRCNGGNDHRIHLRFCRGFVTG